MNRFLCLLATGALVAGCGTKDEGGDDNSIPGDDGIMADGGDEETEGADTAAETGAVDTGGGVTGDPDDDDGDDDDDEGTAGSPVVFDLGSIPDAGESNTCGAPPPVTCDGDDDDPLHAMGLNCPNGPEVDGVYNGGAEAMYVHQGNLGTSMPPEYPPREGEKFIVMSTGIANEINTEGLFTSTGVSSPDYGLALPAPLNMTAVSATEDCADNPALVGTGECSNTLETQWSQGSGANDYAEVRINVEVPAGTFGFSYDFAFFSEEYPQWFMTQFNDMYVAWLESEQWTGNISFDEMGNPISLKRRFPRQSPGQPGARRHVDERQRGDQVADHDGRRHAG